MLRKLEENIFPDPLRQVHAIVGDWRSILALERQVARPRIQDERIVKSFEAPDTVASQDQAQPALDKEAFFKLLNLKFVLQRLRQLNDVVLYLNIQVRDGKLAFQT